MSKSDLNKTWTLLPDPDELNGTVSLVTTQSDTSPTTISNNQNATFTTHNIKTPTVATNRSNYHSLFLSNGSASKPTVSKYSPSKSATDYLLVRHLNIDESRVSAEWDNFEARFQDLESIHNYESLFDEVFNFPEDSSLKSEEEAVVSKVIVNSEKNKSVTPISLSSCSSIDNNLDRLALSQTANEFNAQPLPNSFDMFAHDLKKSSSSKHLNENSSSSSLNLPFLGSKSIQQPLPFASSMENELNKLPARDNSKPPFIESLDLQTTTMRTSSPSKSHNNVLNRTIDIDKGSSVESLNQQSHANLLANDDEENEVVLNTTYTSWSTDLNQVEKEACVQQEIISKRYGSGPAANKQTPNRTMVYSSSVQNVNNLTQDINNNSLNNDSALGSKNKKVDLNRTYEMDEMMDVDDDQPMDSNTGEATRVLNRTHDLIDDNDLEPAQSAANVTITKPVIAAPSATAKASSQTSRLSTIYNKPKVSTSTSKTPSPLQPKKTELIKPAVQVANGASSGGNTKLPVRNTIPTQIKSGIPSVKLISSTTSHQPTPNSAPLTKQQSFTSTTSNQQQQDVNRLSSSSTASSASTGSTKENRKSTETENKLNGETITNTTTAKSSFGFVSKLKKPGVVAPTSQTNIPSAMNKMTSGVSKLPSGSSIPKMPSSSALPTSALKNPTAIPKKPSSVLTLRNANSQLKK